MITKEAEEAKEAKEVKEKAAGCGDHDVAADDGGNRSR
jgi:hypothetical protein